MIAGKGRKRVGDRESNWNKVRYKTAQSISRYVTYSPVGTFLANCRIGRCPGATTETRVISVFQAQGRREAPVHHAAGLLGLVLGAALNGGTLPLPEQTAHWSAGR